jgi:hypothetical protein
MKIPKYSYSFGFCLLLFLGLLLACGGATETNVRVTGLPQFVCLSSTPRPTDTAIPTRTQLPTSTPISISTPMVYVSYPPVCNYSAPITYQYVCAPNACLPSLVGCQMAYSYPLATPNPAGYWSGGGTGLGPSSTPRPTHTPYPTRTPYPTPTAYVVSENYPMGADAYVGAEGGLQLRFRISHPQIILLPERQLVTWELEIENVGTIPYNALPGAQVFVSHLLISGQVQAGYWYASAEAAQAAGLVIDASSLDIMTVAGGETLALRLAAFTPLGEVYKIGWILDPYSGGYGENQIGGNTALWLNAPDPNNCMGNVGDGFLIPSPSAPVPSPTPSVTPYIPPYSGYGD